MKKSFQFLNNNNIAIQYYIVFPFHFPPHPLKMREEDSFRNIKQGFSIEVTTGKIL